MLEYRIVDGRTSIRDQAQHARHNTHLVDMPLTRKLNHDRAKSLHEMFGTVKIHQD